MDTNRLQEIYDAMSAKYNMSKNFNAFADSMKDDEYARKVYDAMSSKYNMKKSFDEFRASYQSAPSAPSAEEIAEEMQPQDEVNKARKTSLFGPPPAPKKAQEEDSLPLYDEVAREQMRQHLEESGTIDRMEEMEKEARKNKFKAFGEALAYTPQVSSFGVASNIYKDTEEQLADAQRALEASEEHRQNKAMEQTLDIALDKARAGEWGGLGEDNVGNGVVDFGLGLWDSATRMSTWDFGVSDTLNGLTIAQVVKKWEEDPGSLTATERNLLDAMGMATAVQEAYQDQVGIGYAVGESLPQSAGFMASMYLNPASGLGKSLARQAVKKYGRQSIAKNLARIGGDIAETAIMTATTGGGRVVADALDRINGQSTYEIDPETGLVMYGGQEDQKTVGEAVVKAIGSNFIENYSEALGEYFDPLLGMSRRVAAGGLRKMNLDKWADALSDVEPSQMAASIRSLREKAKFGGVFGEIMEEEVGMALNAITVGDYTFSKEEADASNGKKQWIFDLENQLTTALSCAIMSGALTGVETIGNVRYRREMERSVADAEKAARAAVGDEMIAQIDQASPEGMVDILRDAYMDQNLSLQQKRALADYATRRVRMQYYNAADAKARRQVNVTQQNMIDAYEAGRHAQLPQYYNIDQEYRRSEAAINERENAEEIWDAIRLMNNMDENERQNIMRDFSEEDQELIRNWRYNAYRWQGAINHRAEQVEDLVDEYAGQVNPYVVEDEQGNRNVTTAVYGDNVVYVMAQNADGATTIVTNDGRKKMVNANELEHMQTRNADELIERFRQQTTEVVNQETEKNLSYPSEVQEPAQGVVVSTLDGKQWQVAATDGENVEIVGLVFDKKSGQWIPNSGDYRKMTREQFMDWQKAELDRKKANTYEQGDKLVFYVNGEPIDAEITGIDPEGNYYVHVSNLVDGLDKAVSDVYTAEELRKLTTPSSKVSEKTTENESTPTEEIKQSVSEEVADGQNEENVTKPTEIGGGNVNIPAAEVAESVNTALSRVPKDAKGNPLYEQTDADTAWDAIVEETGGDAEMAQRIAEEMVADKKAALTKMQKGKPKKGATVAEKIANEKAHIAAIAQAEQEVAAWEKIAQTEARRREAAMSEADRYAAEMEQKNISEGLSALGEPQSLQEYVLAQLAGGAYKLRWNDKENGTKGFGSHTGLSTEEMKARLSMIDNKNGLTPEEIAHSIVENMDASFGKVDVMDVTDMVIDAVSTYASRRAMLNGMVESRAELMRQQARAEQEAKDAWYMEQYHATEEELAAYNEYLAEFAEEIYGEDVDYEQRIATFAEIQLEYDNQGTDAGLRSSADQGEGLASDREGGRSVGETEQLDRREVLADAAGVAEAEDGRAGGSVSAQSDDRQARIDRAVREYWDNLDNSPEAVVAAERDWKRYQEDLAEDASETIETLENGDVRRIYSRGEIATVVLERDGNVISVDTYEDGALFERTDYDANGNATKVTRYKDGEVVSEQEYKDGKRKVTANVFEMAEEAQRKRKSKKDKDDTTRRGIQESPAESDRVSGEIFGGESLGEGESVSSRGDGGILEEGAGKKKRTAKARRQSDNRQEARDGKAERLSRGISAVQQQAIDEYTRTNPWDANLTDDERGVLNMYRMATINELDELAHKLADKINSGKATPRDRMRYDVLAAYAKSGELKAVADAMGVEYGKPVSLDTIKSLFETFNSDADLAKLFDRVFPLVKKINPTIIYRRFTEADIEEGEDVLPDDILGQYSLQENLIEYNRNQIDSNHCTEQEKASTIVHEMIHAVARYAIRVQEAHNNGVELDIQLPKRLLDAAQSLIEVYDAIKDNEIFNDDRYESGKMYGVSSVHEMLSELANPEFREKLKQVSIENLPSDKKGRVRDALKAIKDFLHRMLGWDSSSAYARTKRVLDKLIDNYDSAGYNKARELADDDFAQQRTYHGSGALFDKFDHSFMGTGEGNQAFGWGTYVTEVEDIGRTYAKFSPALFNIKYAENDYNRAKDKVEFYEMELDSQKSAKYPKDILSMTENALNSSLEELKEAEERYLIQKRKYGRVLYSVEIPDDNGSNYLEWYDVVENKNEIKNRLYERLSEGQGEAYKEELKQEINDVFRFSDNNGKSVYNNLAAYLGGARAASKFLNEMGYVGIKYPTGTLSGGNTDNSNNYVIFNENDLEIVDNIRFRDGTPFFSNAERAVENIKQQKATPEQWLAMIKKENGVKTLTKDEVLAFIRENQIEIEEVEYGTGATFSPNSKRNLESELERGGYTPDDIDNTERILAAWDDEFNDSKLFEYKNGYFDIDDNGKIILSDKATMVKPINSTRLDYTTEGLENKKEMAFVVPTIESWNQSDNIHFGDAGEGRAVAWVRFGETTDADGKRVLVIDEVQSKRHDEGRANGYQSKEKGELLAERDKLYYKMYSDGLTEEEFNRRNEINARLEELGEGRIPDAPFDKNYHELVMKRMLRYAAENGFDKVAWTKGAQQAQRYGLGYAVDDIWHMSEKYHFNFNKYGYSIGSVYTDKNGVITEGNRMFEGQEGVHISDLVGKELATRLMESKPNDKINVNGVVGGEDRNALYDEMIPRFMNKYTKKWGTKVGEVTLPNVEEAGRTMWSVDVTHEMRESVMQGQPMFREGMGAISDREVSYENDPIAKWQGKPRYYGKRASVFAERERARMQKGVEEAAKILGIEVEIVTDASTLKGRKAKAKGWYDINAKKVVVVVPNHVSKGDAVRTVLHEGVAHHGLRELFGAGFDAMLDNIYNNVAPELKARIDAIAERTGVSTSVATEEYLASLAEDTNFEYAKRAGWWAKIKGYFMKMLRKLSMPGITLREEITDNELRFLLWRSYQNLVDPNRYLKPLGYLDDVAKQKELKVGNYAINTVATPRVAEMSEAEEWSAITMQRIEELEAQMAQLDSEIAEMEADRDADDASRYDMWEEQLDVLRKQSQEIYDELEGLYSLEAEDEDIEDYETEREAEKQRQLYQKRIDNAYLKAVREGNWEEATNLFRQYVLSKAEDEGIVPMDYGVGYRGGAHSSIAKKVKEENPDAIAEAAYQMSIRIPKGSILVPMPSRTGNATYTVKLAEAIAKATDSEVRDVLKGKARMSVYEAKQKGIKMTPEDLGMYTTEELPKGKNIVIIDNVIDKGTTALAAVSAVNGASVVAYAYTLGDKQRAATLKLAEPVTYDDNKRIIPLSQRFDKETDDIRYRLVDDQAEIDRLESEPTIKAYRAMQVINGELYPPMSAVVDGKLREPIALGQWEQSEERPDLADDNGRFKLDKGNKKSLKAAYNPYFHSSSTPLNDQFSEAQDREKLVTVEVEVPVSEADGTSGYKAEKAKDAVGTHQWKAGIIQGQLTGTREVFLTRWDKPVRIVPESEVADVIVEMFDGKDIVMPSNVVTPQLRKELEARGIDFVETDNQGKLVEGEHKGEHYSKVYGKKGNGGLRYRTDADERFNKELDDFKEKRHKGLMHLGETGSILRAAGVDAKEITMSPTVLHQHLKKHGLTADDLKGLAGAIQSPILVYKHGEKHPNLVIATEIDVNGGKLSISLKLDKDGKVVEVSNVSSVHSKEASKEIERLSMLDSETLKEYLRWVEKEKVSDWLGLPYEEERQDANPKLVSIAKVINEFVNPKVDGENLLNSEEIIAEVERESANLGVQVRIARSIDELPDDIETRKRAEDGSLKGYYDTRTGEVVVYLPNTENANDAKRTILHETVGHKGLRQLIGEERYDKAMVQLMYMLPSEVRDAVLRRAERHGWNAAIAMDEYLADQAERDVQPSWWGKVNAKIRALLRNIGFNVMLTDADVTYLLWRSRKKLMGDTAFDMATNAILKQAARKSVNYDAESDNAIRHRGVEQGKKISEAVSDYYEKYTATTNADKFWGGVKYMATHLGDGGTRALLNDLSESQFEDIRSVRVLEEAIESAEGKPLRENEMVHKSLNAKTSRDARDMDKSQTRYFQPMAKLLGKILGKKIDGRKIEIDDVERYLICKHSPENNEFLMKRAHAENRRKKIHERAKELMKGTITEEEAIAQATSEYTLHQSDFRDDYSGLTELFPDEMVREAKITERTEELTSNGVDEVTARQMASREFESYEPTLEDREKMAADEVARFEAAVDGLHEELWGIINGINRDTIERLFRSGLISRSLYNDLKKRHKFYVPLSGWKNDAAADIYNYAMYGFDGTPIQTVIKKAFGTKYQARNILGSMFAMNMAAITEGNQNLVKQKLYNLALNHDTGVLQIVDLWEVKDGEGDAAEWKPAPKPELRPTMSDAEMQKALTDYQNKLMEMEKDGKARKAVNSLADNFGKHTTDKEAKRHHVELLVNGRKVVIWVNGNPKLAQAINGDLKVKKELLFFDGAVDKANRFLAQVQTSLNPEFMISNFERDILSASRYNLIKYGPKYEASFMKHLAQLMPIVSETNADMRSDVWGGAGIFNLFALDRNTNNQNRKPDAQVLDMNNPLHREFVNFLNYGGKTGYVERKQAEDLQQRIKKLSKREQAIIRKYPAEVAGWAVDTIEHLNEGIENATRFAAYLTARERGKSVTEAVFEAKEVSVNFNMQGSGAWGNASYRKLYNYFNVGLQSLRREKNLGREFPKAYIANLSFMMALGAISTVLLTADWDGDDEDEYMGLSDFNRYNYINVKTENGFIHYSLPQDLRAFYAIGCISTEWAMGKIDGSRAMQAYATQANNYTPLSFVSTTIDREPDSNPVKNLAMSFVPSAAVPVAEIAVNEDFLGRRIHNQNQWNEYEPEWQRAGYRTPEWVINASKALSEAGGGTEHKRGVWFTEINPSNAWHIMDSYGGGFLDFAQKTYNLVEREFAGKEHELRDYPMVSKFYVESGQDYSKQRVVNDRYRMYREDYETIDNELNGYLKDKSNALGKLSVRAKEEGLPESVVNKERAEIEKTYEDNVNRIKESPNYWIYESFAPYEKGYNKLNSNLGKARKSGSEQTEKELSGEMYNVRKKLVDEIDAKRERPIDRVRQWLGN